MAKYLLPAEAPFASLVVLKRIDANRRTTVLLTDEPGPALDDIVVREGYRAKISADGEVTPTGEPTMWLLDPKDRVEVLAEEVHGGPP